MKNHLAEYLPEEVFLSGGRVELHDAAYRKFVRIVPTAQNERPIQKFLSAHPRLMASLSSESHGYWVLPQKRLGCEFVPDFLVGDLSSLGIRWTAVELESPKAVLFTKRGDPSAALSHAIRQIQDWRAWIADNRSYAQRKMSRGGLGLFGIRSQMEGYIFIGRRASLRDSDANLRLEMCDELKIRIHTYDWLIDYAALFSGNVADIQQPIQVPP